MQTRKQVVRTDLWLDASFEARLARETDIDLARLPVASTEADAFALLARAHVFHVSPAKDELPRHLFVDDALLARCPNLVCVSSAGAGFDTIDAAACTRAGVLLVNQAGGNAASVAELAIGLLLDVSRRITECDRKLRRERGFSREDVMGSEIGGKVIGLIGLGHTGGRVAALARAFGMTVLASDPYLTEEEIRRRGAQSVSLADLLEQSDVVSIHCPRDKTTMKMIDAAAYAKMKKGAIMISTARGGIHDEAALTAALRSGHLGGAGLDVWDQEPPPLDHPLLAMENVVATFHTAGVSHEARRNVATIAAEQIVGVLKGGHPPRLINPEVWPAHSQRFERLMGFAVQPAGSSAD